MLPTSQTPQPYRTDNPGREYPRHNYETELWDSMGCGVSYAADSTITVLMPVDGVLDLAVCMDIDTAGAVVTLDLDLTPLTPVYTAPGVGTFSFMTVLPVNKGTHTVLFTVSGGLVSNPQMRVRRGRAL